MKDFNYVPPDGLYPIGDRVLKPAEMALRSERLSVDRKFLLERIKISKKNPATNPSPRGSPSGSALTTRALPSGSTPNGPR